MAAKTVRQSLQKQFQDAADNNITGIVEPWDAAILAELLDCSPENAAQDEALRGLLSYCQEREVYRGRDNEIGADTAYGDVAEKLAQILDGESG